ncbi:hypothetical protein [Kallotenue papyrolyticum]|uniref:hypothetical protein n=1 Tax=Kallotenue papyrolyticum TaxID=1325125 RepID=UPI0004BC2C2C|nr:hypothetical protein [Kallotenue papyrolyticum]
MSHAEHDRLLSPETRAFYCQMLRALNAAQVPYLVGGAYAFERYTGIARDTKDLDIFLRPTDYERVADLLAAQGCRVELTFPHWLGKAHCGDDFIDLIFSSGNAASTVDDEWFAHAVADEVLGIPCLLNPAEEMIWTKAMIMERERYDGADVAHLLLARAASLDWQRLLRRFGVHWRVLLSHLILFGFIYPGERDALPTWVMQTLLDRLQQELRIAPPSVRLCQGTLLSRAQFLIDVEQWGYQDGRLIPGGGMTVEERRQWTAAIDDEPTARTG